MTALDPIPGVFIGAREIYDQVMQLRGQVTVLAAEIQGMKDTVRDHNTDHETRLRVLERSRWPLPSVAVLLSIGALLVPLLRGS